MEMKSNVVVTTRRSRPRFRGLLLACGAVALLLAGCDKGDVGPRRADHAAAHSERYHPDIHRALRNDVPTGTADAAATQPGTTSGPAPVGSPVLFVNGDTVSVPEILEPIIGELENEARTMTPQLYYGSLQRQIRRQIDVHISTILIYQEAKDFYPDKAMEAVDKEVDRRIKEIVTDRYQGVYARYEAQLKAMDLTTNDVKARIKRQILVTQYMRDKFKTLLREPPRRELLKYYQDHIDEFTTPERAELFLIEIPYDEVLGKARNTATAEELAEARRKAVAQLRRAREELESGIEFATVARAYSKGLKATQGGAWGEVGPGALQGRWAKAVETLFSLSENQTSDVVESDEFAYIVRCGKRVSLQRVSFEGAQPTLIERLKDEQFNRLSQEYVESLLAKATIRPVVEFTQAVVSASPRPASVPALDDNLE